jgi:hypothetical protein
MDDLVLGFLTLGIKSQKFYEFSTSKFLAIFRGFDIFHKQLNFKCL